MSITSEIFAGTVVGRVSLGRLKGTIAGALILASSLWLLFHGQLNLLFGLLICGTLIVLTSRDVRAGILTTCAYLFLQGDIRRILGSISGWPDRDLLLMIGPLITFWIAIPILARLRVRDNLSRAVLALMAVMLLEVLNPLQGSVAVGIAGVFFYLVPVLWFWIGQCYGDQQTVDSLIYKILLPLAIGAAVLGLFQLYIGFLPWEQSWIDNVRQHYAALSVGGSTRPFGFSVSSAEYTVLLAYGTVGVLSCLFFRRKLWLLAAPLLAVALFYASGRGVLVKTLLALAAIAAFRNRSRTSTVRFAFLLPVVLIGVVLAASQFAGEGTPGKPQSAQEALAQHQLQGLAHPLDKKYSTAGIHGTMILSGFAGAITHPFGEGLGSTTMASQKVGDEIQTEGSTEADVSDMFASLGIIGGAIYLFIVIQALRLAIVYAQTAPKQIGIPVFALLVCSAGAWLIAGQYASDTLLWFLIGSASKLNALQPPLTSPTLQTKLSQGGGSSFGSKPLPWAGIRPYIGRGA